MFGLPIPDWAWRWLAILFIAIAFVAAGEIHGRGVIQERWNEAIGKAAAEAVRIVRVQGAETEKVVTKYRDRVGAERVVTETIEKEVTKYVESKPLALACLLDTRWVQLHDAAAGSLPASSGGTDVPSGTTVAAALSTITENYARANRNAAKLTSLQEWVRAQEQVK